MYTVHADIWNRMERKGAKGEGKREREGRRGRERIDGGEKLLQNVLTEPRVHVTFLPLCSTASMHFKTTCGADCSCSLN